MCFVPTLINLFYIAFIVLMCAHSRVMPRIIDPAYPVASPLRYRPAPAALEPSYARLYSPPRQAKKSYRYWQGFGSDGLAGLYDFVRK